ncbi:MAG: hypothetical protein JWP00_2230 [Chloroflexi bacterium]|nr:hypothetical protein [Chloroflexota bacterium]
MSLKSNTGRPRRGGVLCGIALVGFLLVALGLGLFLAPSGSVQAQTTGTPTAGATTAGATTAAATTVAGTTVAGTTAAPGGSPTINVFCLDFGKQFPEGQTIRATGLADAKVRSGLAYALSKGYVTSNPYQVQLAVWRLQDNQPYHDLRNAGTAIAEEIVTNAATTAAPQGDASQVNNLTLTNIRETSPQSAYGTATIQGTINTQGLPVGFLLPASGPNFQNMVAVVSTGGAAQATTAAATTAAATTAAVTTAAPTTAAVTTAAVTTVAATTVAATTAAPATVAGQGGAPAAPASGFGGASDNSGTTLGLLSLVLGFSVLALAALFGMQMVSRKNR